MLQASEPATMSTTAATRTGWSFSSVSWPVSDSSGSSVSAHGAQAAARLETLGSSPPSSAASLRSRLLTDSSGRSRLLRVGYFLLIQFYLG
jgi:hypothetical protein